MARSRAENNKCVNRDLVPRTEDSQSGMDTPHFHGVVHTLIIVTCGKEWQQFVSAPIVLRATLFPTFIGGLPTKLLAPAAVSVTLYFSRTLPHMKAAPSQEKLRA